ncbi:Galactose-3-O-sulfotransferase [Branchiostoma belcheri]|nr:Galactose-3-O-sulfotransferase [Branchiostoma belcheri]
MCNHCSLHGIRVRSLLLVPVVTLMVAIATYQTWRPFDMSALGQVHHGKQSKSYGLRLGRVNDDISDVKTYRANSKETLNDVISVTKIGEGRKVFDELNVSNSGGSKMTAGKKDEDTARKCQPKSNIVFLKTHKTASSTVQNILMRYGLARNLTFVLPYSSHILSTNIRFSKSAVLQERLHGDRHGNRTAYNILCHHTRFQYDNIRDLMPDDTLYVTIVRNPAAMFESSFQYFRFDSRYHITQPNAMEKFLDDPSHYVKKFGEKPHSHNALFYDLGYDSEALTSEQTIKSAIDRLDRIFSVVMVSDYFEESVVLLKHELCWDIDDVTFFKVNSRNEKSDSAKDNATCRQMATPEVPFTKELQRRERTAFRRLGERRPTNYWHINMVRLFLGLGLLAILGLLTGTEAQACPGRFKGFNGRCYGYFGGGKPASYRDAARFCTGLGAEIFMMRDPTEVARLKQLLSKQNLKSFWVGLIGDITPGSWTWADADSRDDRRQHVTTITTLSSMLQAKPEEFLGRPYRRHHAWLVDLNLKSFWVGLTGDITPVSWTWSDGAALAADDFTAWDGDKLCAFARKQNNYRWGVTGCGEKRAFICVKDP